MLQPTRDDRGWVINPFVNPVWCIGAAVPPAILATILIFMDQQITAVIVNRKENLLKVSITYIYIVGKMMAVISKFKLPTFTGIYRQCICTIVHAHSGMYILTIRLYLI